MIIYKKGKQNLLLFAMGYMRLLLLQNSRRFPSKNDLMNHSCQAAFEYFELKYLKSIQGWEEVKAAEKKIDRILFFFSDIFFFFSRMEC